MRKYYFSKKRLLKITSDIINKLKSRLKIGNRRGVHLNAFPRRSRKKFDFNRLKYYDENLPEKFIKTLLNKPEFKFIIHNKNSGFDLNAMLEEEHVEIARIENSFQNLLSDVTSIESETGINTFGFGFPILFFKDKKDNKLTAAPIFIWSLRLKKVYNSPNKWEVIREDGDPVVLNEVLQNHIKNDSNVDISDIFSEKDEHLDEPRLINLYNDLLIKLNRLNKAYEHRDVQDKLYSILEIKDSKHYNNLSLSHDNALIEFAGLFASFSVQKQSIIGDYEKIEDDSLYSHYLDSSGIQLTNHEDIGFTNSITSFQTDATQQSILNYLKTFDKNVIIHGPPGTGKSQTLTSIIINALSNNLKILVVCEKITALNILHENLRELNLDHHSVLLKDVTSGRRNVVEIVRNKTDNGLRRSTSSHGAQYLKEKIKDLNKKTESIIKGINDSNKRINDEIIINQDKWKDIVGKYLSLRKKEHLVDLLEANWNTHTFTYNSNELNTFTDLIASGSRLYEEYLPFENLAFINRKKFENEDAFILEDNIKRDFKKYHLTYNQINAEIDEFNISYKQNRENEIRNELSLIKNTINDFNTLYDIKYNELCSQIKKSYSDLRNNTCNREKEILTKYINQIKTIFHKHDLESTFYDSKKTNSIIFKISSIFIKRNKEIIDDLKQSSQLINSLNNFLYNSTLFKPLFRKEKGEITLDAPDEVIELINEFEAIVCGFDDYNDITKELETVAFQTIYENETADCLVKMKESLYNLQHKIVPDKSNYSSVEKNKLDQEFDTDFNSFVGNALQDLQNHSNSLLSQVNMLHTNLKTSTISSLQSVKSFLLEESSKPKQNIPDPYDFMQNKKIRSFEFFKKEISSFELEMKTELAKNSPNIKELINEEIRNIDFIQNYEDTRINTDRFIKIGIGLNSLVELINTDDWLTNRIQTDLKSKPSSDRFISEIKKILSIHDKYFEDDQDIFTLEYEFRNWWSKIPEDYFGVILHLHTFVENPKLWLNSFQLCYYQNLLLYKADNLLPKNSRKHEKYLELIREFKELQPKSINHYWLNKQSDAVSKFNQTYVIEVKNLFNYRGGPKNRRRSLREIVKFDLEFFTDFFPVILTTPDTCSRIFQHDIVDTHNTKKSKSLFDDKDLPKRKKHFDIVLFDEASQLRLEDNLPALMKGKKIIVAGDHHQMPPSDYFTAKNDSEEFEYDEEDALDEGEILEDDILNSESLLSFAQNSDFQTKPLDFHYRSRHSGLIEFSNFAFYQQRLQHMPNLIDYCPIDYIQLNGKYGDSINETEADAVIKIIDKKIIPLPNDEFPSIGIATFNIQQRNLIINKMDQKRFVDPKFNEKVIRLNEKGLFIKNLENIQGDERDIIILSTVYGKNEDNRFNQRFGNINRKKRGYRLLNVLITRAKYKIFLCTSIPENIFLGYNKYLSTTKENDTKGIFYAYIAYCKYLSEGNHDGVQSVLNDLSKNSPKAINVNYGNKEDLIESPFEEEVYQYLVEEFNEEFIIPQYKFGSFRIDFVLDFRDNRIPKIAIECDGAQYHSSTESYLYDCQRQSILEENEFVFHRIWSTNWWKNEKKEVRKLLEFITKIKSGSQKTEEQSKYEESPFKNYFSKTQENELNYDLVTKTNDSDDTLKLEEIKNNEGGGFYSHLAEDLQELFNEENNEKIVEYGKIVTIEYLENNKKVQLKILKELTVKNRWKDSILELDAKVPIAVSIMGKKLDSIVQIGGIDVYVKILAIE
ncbi:AAA domain-containing protein [Crocinitomicaceae bacterium]|nr:AAA domain-containing protein [Crocinitomicaceae bacterium]